jgi:hypothetical protein
MKSPLKRRWQKVPADFSTSSLSLHRSSFNPVFFLLNSNKKKTGLKELRWRDKDEVEKSAGTFCQRRLSGETKFPPIFRLHLYLSTGALLIPFFSY